VINISYSKSFVAFLDILGFKDIVNKSRTNEGLKKLNEVFNTINQEIEELKKIPAKKKIGYITISDSIILSIPKSQNNNDNINILRHLCIAIGLIQKNLAMKNIWLRGAISSGDTYFDSKLNQIVGPAYVTAYTLQETIAKTPRVIIDSRIIHELGCESAYDLIDTINELSQGGLRYRNWQSPILHKWDDTNMILTRDVPLFIDYLSPFVINEMVDLLKLIQIIKTNLYEDINLYNKYRWVADYLNVICLKYPDSHEPIITDAMDILSRL